MLKKILILAFVSIVSSCGGGNDSSSGDNGNGTTPSIIPDYSDPNIYPVTDIVVFSRHNTGDIFTLSDGSAWQIVGTTNSGYNTGKVTSNVIIYSTTTNTPDPESVRFLFGW